MSVDKSFMVTLASALLVAVQTTACAPTPSMNQNPPATEQSDALNESSAPTSRDLEVATQLGISQTRIEEMQQDGMKLRERSHIRMAEHLLDLLKEKYGFEFEAQSIVAPEFSDRSWRLKARVPSGGHEGMSVACAISANGDDSECTDDLLSQVRADEVQDYIQSLVMDVCGDQVAYWVGNCVVNETMLSHTMTLDTPTDSLAQHIKTGVWLYFGPEFPLNENGYQEIAHRLKDRLTQADAACVITMRHLTHLPKGREKEGLSLDAAQQVVREGKPGVDYDWETTFGPQSRSEE